jgi:group I intron endonuclease
MKKKDCGIYYIQNKITNQLYIGQSKTLRFRKNRHFSKLRNNKHYNEHLQCSFNKYGEENFDYGIIQYCSESELDELEIAYINLFNVKRHGFNMCDGGYSGGWKKEYAHINLSSFNRRGERMFKLTYNNQIIRSNDKSFLEYLLQKYFDEQGYLKPDYCFEDVKNESKQRMAINKIDNARIVKRGMSNGRIRYSLKYGGKTIKNSIYKEFLEFLISTFFDKNKILKKDISIEDVKQVRWYDVRKGFESSSA